MTKMPPNRLAAILLVGALTPASARAAEPSTIPAASDGAYEDARRHHARFLFDDAAAAYEKAAEDPTSAHAKQALFHAALLRLGLGTDLDVTKAKEDVARFHHIAGPTTASQSLELALALGAHYAAKESWAEVARVIHESRGLTDPLAGIDLRVRAHALLGRAEARQKRELQSSVEYKRVLGLWGEGPAAMKGIADAYPDENDAQKSIRLEKALDAVGEALFARATEYERATLQGLSFPNYLGTSDQPVEVRKHIATKVIAWTHRKWTALEKVEREYRQIVGTPSLSPRWVLAARARIAVLWGTFATEPRKAPYPSRWKKQGCAVHCNTPAEIEWSEVRGLYFALVDEVGERIKTERAKPAFVACFGQARKLEYVDASSRACEVWLERHAPDTYHPVDELRLSPTLSVEPRVGGAPLL
ncbi:MAG: hypothetical protein U0174_15875 [Polyangiaceae bacterium]